MLLKKEITYMSGQPFGIEIASTPKDHKFAENIQPRSHTGWALMHAERGAELMHAMFGAQRNQVSEKLEADYDHLMRHVPDYNQGTPIVGINVDAEDGHWLSFAHVVAGYNRIARNHAIPELAINPAMYSGRTPSWLNRRRPDKRREENGLSDPLHGMLLAPELAQAGTTTYLQQRSLQFITDQPRRNYIQRGVTIVDILMADAAAILDSGADEASLELERIGIDGVTRFLQYPIAHDAAHSSIELGPTSFIDGDGRLHISSRSSNQPRSAGFRTVYSPKR